MIAFSQTADDTQNSSQSLADTITKNEVLRQQLNDVRKRRRRIQTQIAEQETLKQSLRQRLNTLSNQQHESLLEFQSATSDRCEAQKLKSQYHHSNVIVDCFYIWNEGPLAAINGIRLGAESSTTELSANLADASDSQAGMTLATESKRQSYFSSSFSQNENMLNRIVTTSISKVPWKEVNAALGFVALLLSTLEQKNLYGVTFQYDIKATGSTSKIGLRQPNTTSTTLYNLYYNDDSFQFFGKRNFNTAIQYLVQCVADLANIIGKRDRTIFLPYVIEYSVVRSGGNPELTIGGIPVTHGNDNVEWTRAMKYLLTDIKHLIKFKPFGFSC